MQSRRHFDALIARVKGLAAPPVIVICLERADAIADDLQTALLGESDWIIFTGGNRQIAAPIRALALEKLAFLGLLVDEGANAAHAPRINKGKVAILVMATDEEQMIAHAVRQALAAIPDEKGPM
ncbi:hypothetical protein [Roseicyclus sp.]|uniref:hypothetical protein n=1 Tax=Roseicyclus sp. TaxID=1914329 RepID=UPI001BCB30F7